MIALANKTSNLNCLADLSLACLYDKQCSPRCCDRLIIPTKLSSNKPLIHAKLSAKHSHLKDQIINEEQILTHIAFLPHSGPNLELNWS